MSFPTQIVSERTFILTSKFAQILLRIHIMWLGIFIISDLTTNRSVLCTKFQYNFFNSDNYNNFNGNLTALDILRKP